jgi:hypothetical protein
MMELQDEGGGLSGLSNLLGLIGDPEAAGKLSAEIKILDSKLAELREVEASLVELREEIARKETDLAAREASARDMATWLEAKEKGDRELQRVLDRRESEISARETSTFAAREEQLQAGEAKLAQLKKQIDNLLAQFRADLAAL